MQGSCIGIIIKDDSRDQGNPWLPKNMSGKQPYNNISFKYWPEIYCINPSKQPKHALELKLSIFRYFVNCKNFISLTAGLPDCLTTTVDLLLKLLGIWLPFFPRFRLIFVHINLSTIFFAINFHLQ